MSAPNTAAAKPKTPQASAPKAAPKRTRPVFQSPFGNPLGAPLSESDTAALLAICKAHFAAARATLTRFRTEASASAGKRRRADIEQVVDEGDAELFRHADASTAMQGLVLGLNAVTRALENGHLDTVLLCTNVTPPLLISHFPFLSHAQQVPLIKLDCSTSALGATIGLNTAVCIGIRVRCGLHVVHLLSASDII
jgi:ribosomal protein L7Ae-like RNA K-turn-binding protein